MGIQTPHGNTLLFVRHAQPETNAKVPSHEWPLSTKGRQAAADLAERIAHAYSPFTILSSPEPKAAETANIIATKLGLPVQIDRGLREHERPKAHWLEHQQFIAALANFFSRPDDLVFGAETAKQVTRRFTSAVARVLKNSPEGDLIIVTHGTALTLFMAAATNISPIPYWNSLDLPALITLSRSTELSRLVEL